MRHIISCILAAALAFALAPKLVAQVPEASRPAGHVLVLDNENVLEGKIERLGDLYVIAQNGGELRIPAARALIVCATLKDAYSLLARRINTRDGDEHLRLARWCHTHNLPDEAILEAKAALALRPSHAPTKQLLTMLEQATSIAATASRAESPKAQPPMPVPVEVTAACLAEFSAQIQPILMNTCASCHAGDKSGAFRLLRSNDAAAWRTTQINLAATVAQISFEHPAASPLIVKAACAHGGSQQPPLPATLAAALSNLQRWTFTTAAENPQLRARGASAVAAAQPQPVTKTPEPVATASTPAAIAAPVASTPESPPAQPGEARVVAFFSGVENVRTRIPAAGPVAGEFRPVALEEAAAPPFQPTDPFDAGIFNRLEKTAPRQ
jgi:hypothetical protein